MLKDMYPSPESEAFHFSGSFYTFISKMEDINLKDIYLAPESIEDIKNWGVDLLNEPTNKEN